MKTAICVVIIEDGKILLCRKQQTWILPGGKPKPNEDDMKCLLREMEEELPDIRLENIKYFGNFQGIAPHKGYQLTAIVYIAEASGDIRPSAEIDQAMWTDKPEELALSDTTHKIVLSLRQHGYL